MWWSSLNTINILQTHELKYSDPNHVNKVIFNYIIFWMLRKCNMVFKKMIEKRLLFWKKKTFVEEFLGHDIIGVHRSRLDTKAPSPPLIYPVGPLAISDPHIYICVGPPNTCVALKQFNLFPLTHYFEAISFITPWHISLNQ